MSANRGILTAGRWPAHRMRTLAVQTTFGSGRRAISLKSLFTPSPPSDMVHGSSGKKQRILVQPHDLFHPLSKSPVKEMREKGALIQQHGCCTTCVTETTAMGKPATREPTFECPDCGYPTHCSPTHWKQDTTHHDELCGHLREANEDEHDLRSGRTLREFEFPSAQLPEIVVNLSSWDSFLYTRSFTNINSNRAMRHVSKVLTYPVTIGSVLHQFSPFVLSSGLTPEGLKSMTALRTTIKEHDLARSEKELAMQQMPLRVFVLGARAEAMLPPHLYLQLAYLLPNSPVHVYFVGPECIPAADEARSTIVVSSRLVLKYHKSYFHDAIWNFAPFDPYTDVFFMFSPGIGHPRARPGWQPTVEKLLETKCAVFATGFHERDMQSDVRALREDFGDKMDWLLEPRENPFSSLKRDFGIRNLREWAISNWGIYGFRGKRYEVQRQE
ncbi:translational activator for mitochondrial COX1 [Coemansia sp. RSA 353]|nr:translational activator for mitochondrial COX1 [Coemansia sp. RSA 1752]KAJ1783462.1 translational activator for mitochondrial COX1 [Coemansia sp. RSA 1938]KAJ2167733.1 translational activator for mitochondrial COX1 [Coemansia sp. RSA 562]KAJ2200015.1 translational activator for mitochondrial COX1 [Coemansia sp. RSA 522]KAJ2222224.1 translational activator for mitochondrial COX1 [Coemansia sp. RSA 520]KAJ2275194.1 translational activator for mitochondrial COX1 [Coemansia sp. RSA 371]KAJ2283